MPIKPENRARYPKDWPEHVARVRARSGDRCECDGRCGCVWVHLPAPGQRCTFRQGDINPRGSRVVLPVMHLDHNPENNDPANHMHGCQACHLAYDQAHHQETARQTRRARKADGDLFAEVDSPAH
jgi:hypothetical protein